MRKTYSILAGLMTLSMLAACGPKFAPTTAPATMSSPTEQATEAPTAPASIKVGEVTDLGGIDDKAFNADAYQGIQDAVTQLGIKGKYLEAQQQSDYATNIQKFVDEGTDLIVTVGYLLNVDTAAAAKAYPNQKFAIVDYSFPDCSGTLVEGKDCGSAAPLSNVRGIMFQADQAAFLAGYTAAGMTKSGKVATYGGVKLPTVIIYMRGFEAGVKYYNTKHNTTVQVLGWSTAQNDGVFVNNYDSVDDGRAVADSFIQQGADIIMPVAGPLVGLGTAAVCKETNSCLIIGTDTDWYLSAPEYQDVELTSAIKNVNAAVFGTIKDTMDGKFTSGTVTYTLKDNGVDIAPFHSFDDKVPASLKSEISDTKNLLTNGSITVDGVLSAK